MTMAPANDRARYGALESELARIGQEIDAEFDLLLPVPGDQRDRLFQAMRHAAIGGGKRLRPLLLVTVAEMHGVSRGVALRIATAVEAIHVYSLIHDDLPCMDDDDMRRGKPTVHRAFDEPTAVLAGDSLHALAFEILIRARRGVAELNRIPVGQLLLAGAGFEFGFEHKLGLLCGDDLAFGEAHVALHGVHLERQRQ